MIRRERKPADLNPARMSGHSHLSPWDFSGLGYGFGLYRPRRPSYTYATQVQRARSESYRYAVRKSTSDLGEAPDFIEGILSKHRKESYIKATRSDEPSGLVEMHSIELPSPNPQHFSASSPNLTDGDGNKNRLGGASNIGNQNNHSEQQSAHCTRLNGTQTRPKIHLSKASSENHIQELKAAVSKKRLPPSNNSSPVANHSPANKRIRKKSMAAAMRANEIDEYHEDSSVFASDNPDLEPEVGTPCSADEPPFPTGPFKRLRFKKNLLFLCLSFILIFSAFRAIQNLQSSLNATDSLGIIAMTCVHGTMCLTCLWAPMIINNVTAKWTLVIGMFSFILWIAANFFPRFYTLIPFGILAGVGQGILWTAESSYILKLAFDSSRVTKDGIEKETFRFHGIFLACFQTTHIWGNLISSLVLHGAKNALSSSQPPAYGPELQPLSCGMHYPCKNTPQTDITKDVPSTLYKLMSAYTALGFLAFFLVMLCLDKIGARVCPEKSGYLIVVDHVTMMVTHKTFRLLIPLLIFSGLQQAFAFSDFTHAYVTCTMGEEYIGYSMIILGLANVLSAILVAACANIIPREFVFGVGGIIHMGLLIGMLVWIPSRSLAILFVLSASWGFCDAVWQTQCNTLICITCPEDTDMAFANYRMLQSFGLTVGFLSGTFMCVSFKLYILMILLVVAIMFYVLAEYRVRQVDGDMFEGQIEVN